ncbi:MAG: hypothetical protein HC799_10760 [Limnothrix sp. RL_2_0]|nr:hypothetical protein [Limnothrix sp. RL_2_0]
MKLSTAISLSAAVVGTLAIAIAPAIAQPRNFTVASSGSQVSIQTNGQAFSGPIRGTAGGNMDSVGCGWMSNTPNHTFTIGPGGIVSMKLSVTDANGGTQKPYTLMIKNASDPNATPFCAIADPFSNAKAEIGGVWNPGNYQVFIGNFETQNQKDAYVLNISP